MTEIEAYNIETREWETHCISRYAELCKSKKHIMVMCPELLGDEKR